MPSSSSFKQLYLLQLSNVKWETSAAIWTAHFFFFFLVPPPPATTTQTFHEQTEQHHGFSSHLYTFPTASKCQVKYLSNTIFADLLQPASVKWNTSTTPSSLISCNHQVLREILKQQRAKYRVSTFSSSHISLNHQGPSTILQQQNVQHHLPSSVYTPGSGISLRLRGFWGKAWRFIPQQRFRINE